MAVFGMLRARYTEGDLASAGACGKANETGASANNKNLHSRWSQEPV